MSKTGAPLINATFLKPTKWSEKKEYKLYDYVVINSYVYMAIRDVPKGKNPIDAENAQYWKPFITGEGPVQ